MTVYIENYTSTTDEHIRQTVTSKYQLKLLPNEFYIHQITKNMEPDRKDTTEITGYVLNDIMIFMTHG